MNRGRQIAPPLRLKSLQAGFGESIRTPFSFGTGRFECRRGAYPPEAIARVAPGGGSDGSERLALYNEQYWYRLLSVLQEDFPMLAGSLGYWEFNQLATRYLTRFPSRSPYLDDLGKMLPEFVRWENAGRKAIQSVDMDAAFLLAFRCPEVEPLDPRRLSPDELGRLGESPLRFQPGLSLVEEDWNLMQCRESFLRDGSERPACVEGKGYWVVFRREMVVEWKAVEAAPFRLLRELESGHPMGTALERAAGALGDAGCIPPDGIPGLFTEWVGLKWFRHPGS